VSYLPQNSGKYYKETYRSVEQGQESGVREARVADLFERIYESSQVIERESL